MNKQIKLAIAALLVAHTAPFNASAEGYQVNTLSARQNGMAHTGAAIPLASESMFFNPAGMGFMSQRIDFSGSVTAIIPTASAKIGANTYNNLSTTATPVNANLAMKVNDKVAVGVSFYTPYGSSIDWGENWPGAELNQRVDLKVFTLQPSVSWRLLPNVSIGAGVMVTWGTVDLHKGLVNPTTLDNVLIMQGISPVPVFNNTVPASVGLSGTSKLTAGINIGAMWQINKKWTLGASWRSQQNLKVDAGIAHVTYANEIARNVLETQLRLINEANFSAQMPAPWVLSVGTSFRPTEKLLLAADVQLSGWKAYQSLDVVFNNRDLAAFDQHITKDYKNSFTYKIGAQYSVTKRFDARLGLMFDTTPVNDKHYNPETPGTTKIAPSAGLSFFPLENFGIHASVLYVAGLNRTGSCTYVDMLTKTPTTFTAEYKVHAWAPSLGVQLRF